jgi:hypothetical protein
MPAPSRAWLVAGGYDGGEVARWGSSAAPRRGVALPCLDAKLAVGGDLMAAEAAAGDTGSLEVADVIYRRDGSGCTAPLTWLARTLDCYPGCGVAAIRGEGGGYLAAPRVTRPLTFSFLMPNDDGFNALACAMFVYGWLAAGWPSAALERSQLEVSAMLRLPMRKKMVRTMAMIQFGLFYEGPAPASASSAGPS